MKMINVRTIRKLKEDEGLTLKDGKIITYKTGWQVATESVEFTTPEEAIKAVKAYNGNCGIWYSSGIYYIDKSKRISTKAEALKIGKEHNQISIYGWKTGRLAYC